jgi:hypothetical protein
MQHACDLSKRPVSVNPKAKPDTQPLALDESCNLLHAIGWRICRQSEASEQQSPSATLMDTSRDTYVDTRRLLKRCTRKHLNDPSLHANEAVVVVGVTPRSPPVKRPPACPLVFLPTTLSQISTCSSHHVSKPSSSLSTLLQRSQEFRTLSLFCITRVCSLPPSSWPCPAPTIHSMASQTRSTAPSQESCRVSTREQTTCHTYLECLELEICRQACKPLEVR